MLCSIHSKLSIGDAATTSGSLPPRDSLGYQVNHLARLLEHALRDRIAAYGVVPGQFAQLLALYDTDGVTQAELCTRVRIEQPTMARTLARMERDGLVVRTPDPADRRSALVALTPRARRLEGDLADAARSVNARATAGLDDHEIAAFLRTLAAVIANLESTDPTEETPWSSVRPTST